MTDPYLEGEPEVDEEGMLERPQYLYLPEDVTHRVLLDDQVLVHVLHRVHFLRVLLLDNTHL